VAHFERQPRDAGDHDGHAYVGSFGTDRAPDFAVHPDAPRRLAFVDDDALGTEERLAPDSRPPASGATDPEARLTELDRQPGEDRQDAPARRQDEERQCDGGD
jgi:hypothetical protein